MPPRSRISATLPPEQNALPAPVSTAARTEGSALSRAKTDSNAANIASPDSALRVSGRFSVSSTTAPCCW